jgi:hypothetical protein
MSTEREVEISCLEKIRGRAKKLMAENPALHRDAAFAQAAQQLPQTMNRYLHAVAVLGVRGIKGLPLWE